MTILEILQSRDYASKNIIEKLLCHLLACTRTELFAHSDRIISDEQLLRIQHSYQAYTLHKQPLEYILGHVEFFNEPFIVTPATLIPRPETEYMIQSILNDTQSYDTLIDVGTWCGVLWLSVLMHSKQRFQQAYLTDYSTDALAVAKQNYTVKLTEHKIPQNSDTFSVAFVHSDLLTTPILQQALSSPTAHILLVANLPYIPEETFENNVEDNVKKREPKMAFVWWDDGLDLYRRMFDQILTYRWWSGAIAANSWDQWPSLHAPKDWLVMYLEMMTRQVDILKNEYTQNFHFEEVATFHFNIRIVKTTIL